MKLLRWQINKLHLPMVDLGDGLVGCVTGPIARALGVLEHNLIQVAQRHAGELDSLTITNSVSKEFFREHRTEFGLQRVNGNARLWTENDILLFGVLSRSEHGKEFRKQFVEQMKQHVVKTYVTREQFNTLLEENKHMRGQIDDLRNLVLSAQPALTVAATAAGAALQAQRNVKRLYLVE